MTAESVIFFILGLFNLAIGINIIYKVYADPNKYKLTGSLIKRIKDWLKYY